MRVTYGFCFQEFRNTYGRRENRLSLSSGVQRKFQQQDSRGKILFTFTCIGCISTQHPSEVNSFLPISRLFPSRLLQSLDTRSGTIESGNKLVIWMGNIFNFINLRLRFLRKSTDYKFEHRSVTQLIYIFFVS